jgi:hypothetical protein
MGEAVSLSASLVWTREVLVQWRRWTRSHWLMTLALSTLAFVIGWVWNTYLMAVDLDGSQVGPGTQTTATADGHAGNGLFWLLLFSLAGGLVTYAWSRGWRNFWADMAALPRRFGEAMTSSRSGALAMLLWGVSVSLVISTVISSAVSLALGLVLLALAATPVGVILNFTLIRLWRGLCGIITPNVGARLAVMVSPFMVMVGEALGLFLDWMLGGWLIGLLLGVGCAVASVVLVRAAPPPRAAVMLIVAGAVIAWQVVRVRWAYADDGGWSECATAEGQPCAELGLGGIVAWLGSPGAGHVVARGSVGGVFAAVGAVLGVGIGGAAAGLAVAAAQASASGQPARSSTGGPDRHGQPGPAEVQGPAERGRVYQSGSTGVDPSGRGQVYQSGSTGVDPSGRGDGPPAQSDGGQPPPQRTAASPPQSTAPLGVAQQGTWQQSAFQQGSPPDFGQSEQPHPDAPGRDGQPDWYADIEDVLPEPPDREEDENGEGPTRRLSPQA